MQTNPKLIIENIGNSFFANLANISVALFIYFWVLNLSLQNIATDLKDPIIMIICLSLIQLFTKYFLLKKIPIIEQLIYLCLIGTWIFTTTLVYKSNQVDLIIFYNFAIISLIFVNALLPNNLQLLNSIFFISILFLKIFFSFSTTYFDLKIISLFTAFISFLALFFSFIIFKQSDRRKKSYKRLDTLLKDLLIKKKKIEHKELRQSQFLASICHDLKQPMHAINLYLGSVERILFNIKMQEIQATRSSESIHKLKQSVSYMNNVLESLLEVSRLEQGVSKVSLTELRVNEFFKKIINQHLKTTNELGLKLEFVSNLKNNLTITSDLRLLERIFRNLLSNAIKYTKKGGVRVRLIDQKKLIKLNVIDTGSGIHQSMKKRIFDEFSQIEDSNNKRGIGLGLAIVKKLSGKIGAYVGLKSHLGIGSVFTLYLPKTITNKKHRVKNILESEMISDVLPQIVMTEASQTTVLVVDQNEDSRDAFESLSHNLGINFITGISSENVIYETANLHSIPKLLIVDSSNSIEHPLKTIENIKNEFNIEIPALLITEDIENESMLIKSYTNITPLQKPFSTSKLQQTLQKILSTKLSIKSN